MNIRRLRELREATHLRPAAFAQLAGIDKGNYWRLENGEVPNPSGETLRRIADALGVTVDVLLAPDEDAPPSPDPTLADVARKLDDMLAAITSGAVGAAWAGPPPALPDVPIRDVDAGVRGRLFPVPAGGDPALPDIPPASVVWIDPAGEPVPGKIVLVEAGGQRRLKRYEGGNDVLGVARLVQWTLP